MAVGDLIVFEEFPVQLGKEIHNLATDTIKLGIINNTLDPTAADATPTWTDYSANEVSAGGGYTAGGISLTSVTWTETDGVSTLDADNVSLVQNAAGFTNGYWGVIFNDTATNKDALAFVDLGGPASEQAGPININWGAAGILKYTVSN
jgi:hypothetical protein